MKGIIAGVVGLMWSAGAMADGNQLLAECQASLRSMEGQVATFDAGICLGRVSTVIVMMQGMGDEMPLKYRACLPEQGIQNGQGIRIVTKYLNENPKFLHLDDTLLAIKALQTAYPCQ